MSSGRLRLVLPDAAGPGEGPLLGDFAGRYCLERGLRASSAAQLAAAVAGLERWRGRPVRLAELAEPLLNDYLAAATVAASTLRRRRGALLALWRHAATAGLVAGGPGAVRPVREPRRLPEAWSMAEMAALLRAAEARPGRLPDGRRAWAAWWPALLRAGYDTALRLADLLALPPAILAGPEFRVCQAKTGQELRCAVRPATRAALRAVLVPGEPTILAWRWSRPLFYCHWRGLIAAAGLAGGRRCGPQKLRRTAASHCERAAPGTGARLLGHLTAGLAERHYFDPSIVRPAVILPPPLPSSPGAGATLPSSPGAGATLPSSPGLS